MIHRVAIVFIKFIHKISCLFTLLSIVSCANPKTIIEEEFNPLTDLNEKLDQLIKNAKPSSLIYFYKTSKGGSVWLNDELELNSKGQKVFELISSSEDYGLISNKYRSIKNILSLNGLSKDTALTHYFIEFIIDLKYGMVNDLENDSPFKMTKRDENKLIKEIAEKIRKDKIDQLLLDIQPDHVQYQSLINQLKQYNKRTKLSELNVKVPSYKQDSTYSRLKAAEALFNYGLIDSLDVSDSLFIKGIIKFQKEHGLNPDAVIGPNTSKLLSKSPYHYFLYAVTALEKWRKRANWSKDRIEINIPGFELKYFQLDKELNTHKVIVGTKKTPTPEILDTLEHLVVYPYWYVPNSIVFNELIPKAKQDSTYFRRNGYDLLSGTNIINSENIDLNSSFSYKVRQKGGNLNALGLIKFIFPNSEYIYLHDTPSKKLFNKEVRAFSHGCIRLEDPLSLASKLLDSDQNTYQIDSVEVLIKNRQRTRINMDQFIPIYIHYTLVSASKDNGIIFHEDLYEKDTMLLSAVRKLSE